MDKVRFGRALGYGARHAAKTLWAAADAAAAPAASSAPAAPASAPQVAPTQRAPVTTAPPPTREPHPTSANTLHPPAPGRSAPVLGQVVRGAAQVRAAQREAGRQAKRSFFGPLAKFSSVVSLQVTGTFFALIAIMMAQAAWRARAALHLGAASNDGRRFYLVAGIALLFAYFAISNFLRARRRDRRT